MRDQLVSVSVEEWIADREAAGSISSSSALAYRVALRSLLKAVGADVTVGGLDAHHLRAWLRRIAKLAPATKYARLSAISTWLDWCVREGIIDANPADKVDRPKVTKGKPRPIPVEAAKRAIELADPRTRVMALLAWEMGLRRAEIAGLRVENIDWEERLLIVKGKGSKERVLPLTEGVRSELAKYLRATGIAAGWVFPSRDNPGGHLTPPRVGNIIKAMGYKVGRRDMTTHRYRHRALTDIARESGILTAQYVAGHASVATTQIYAQADLDAARAALNGRNFA